MIFETVENWQQFQLIALIHGRKVFFNKAKQQTKLGLFEISFSKLYQKEMMKNHIQLSEEIRIFVSAVTWVTGMSDTHTSPWFFTDLREPSQLASVTVLQGTIGLCDVMLASIWDLEIQKKIRIWYIDFSSISSEYILDWYYIHYTLTFYSGRSFLNSIGRFLHKVPNENSSFSPQVRPWLAQIYPFFLWQIFSNKFVPHVFMITF